MREGDKERLLTLVEKKLQKGQTFEEIADAVEESIDTVKELIKELIKELKEKV